MINMTTPTPRFSVVIPLYNHERYIRCALQSVLDQTLAADEIIVIDDGSKDNGFSIAREILKFHASAKVIQQENAGAHATINRAISIAENDYIAVLNSDDAFLASKLARCAQLFQENKDIDLIFGNVQIVDDNDVVKTEGVSIDWLERARLFHKKYPCLQLALLHENFATTTSNFVFKKSLWEAVGGFANLRYCHDLDFLMQSFDRKAVFQDMEPHIKYRVHDSNTISENLDLIRLEIAAVVAATIKDSGQNIWGGQLSGNLLTGLKEMLEAKNLNQTIIVLLSIISGMNSRNDFYDYLAQPEVKHSLVGLI